MSSPVTTAVFVAPGTPNPTAKRQAARDAAPKPVVADRKPADGDRVKTRPCPSCGGPILDRPDHPIIAHRKYLMTKGATMRASGPPCPASNTVLAATPVDAK